jgi:hypothetical protein
MAEQSLDYRKFAVCPTAKNPGPEGMASISTQSGEIDL